MVAEEYDVVGRADGEPSSTVPDWSREAVRFFEWAPSRKLLRTIRDHQRWKRSRSPLARIFTKTAAIRHRFWQVVCGADIPLACEIGGGLIMPHPNGIVIHVNAVIGPNCLLMQQVTLGTRDGGPPRLAGHVDIGAGAKVLGPITIAEHAVVGACALVLDDVPARTTVGGVPAKPLRRAIKA